MKAVSDVNKRKITLESFAQTTKETKGSLIAHGHIKMISLLFPFCDIPLCFTCLNLSSIATIGWIFWLSSKHKAWFTISVFLIFRRPIYCGQLIVKKTFFVFSHRKDYTIELHPWSRLGYAIVSAVTEKKFCWAACCDIFGHFIKFRFCQKGAKNYQLFQFRSYQCLWIKFLAYLHRCCGQSCPLLM